MTSIQFDGQQSDERILYVITPHQYATYIAISKIVLLSILFFLILSFIAGVLPGAYSSAIRMSGFIFSLILIISGVLWNQKVYHQSKTYITDRRIIRFEIVSPFFQAKRMLFWSEALKAKAFSPNLFYRMLKIGTIQVEPHLSGGENVRVTDVYYFEDLANYIDKILYVVKNSPQEITSLRPFVPKPKGERG